MKDTKHVSESGAWAGSMPSNAWDPDADKYWRHAYEQEGYFQKGMTYDDYEPAYRYGYDLHHRHKGEKWDDVERDMGGEWDKFKAKSRLSWEHAKHAVKAAWDHMEDHLHGKKHELHR